MSSSMRLAAWSVLGSFLISCASSNSSNPSAESEGLGDGEIPGDPNGGGNTRTATPGDVSFGPGADPGTSVGPAAPGTPVGPADPGAGAPGTPSPVVAGPSLSPSPAEPAAEGGAIAAPVPLPPSDETTENPPPTLEPGTLTAGSWDDNQNFDRFIEYWEELYGSQLAGLLPFDASEPIEVQELGLGIPAPHQTLDVSLVIDTTGSMGDELRYLQTEFTALSTAIEAAYPNAEQRWSLVLYRDQGDEYVTRWFDFRDDAEEFRVKLAEQAADGGGDTPEAPDAALEVMNELAWRTGDDTARLAFWVADAPHHSEKAAALANAIRTSQNLGIHLYPVASSGVDELTEISMRTAAQLTGGRYLFLTDDSGVGGAHKEPSMPCYFVTQLDAAILRMVDIEMSGEYREPAADEIIRTGGDPKDGACTMTSGEVLTAF